MHIPDSISNKWVKWLLRMDQVAKNTEIGHYKLMKATFIVDDSGSLVVWFEPECVRIDPHTGAREWVNKLLT